MHLFEPGDLVHIDYRPRFQGDPRARQFVGEVEAETPVAIRVAGYAFLCDADRKALVKTKKRRSEVAPLGTADVVITALPEGVDLDALNLTTSDGTRLLTDGTFQLAISIRSANG